MAFIVEMCWGRPPGIWVYTLDSEGELAPSHFIPSSEPPDPEWRTFLCHWVVWEDVLNLGREAGWVPEGTTPAKLSCERWEANGRFDASYKPEEWSYAKHFKATDAASLADALQRVLDTGTDLSKAARPKSILLRSDMRPGELIAANRGLSPEFLRDFIAFLRKGCFEFAFDD